MSDQGKADRAPFAGPHAAPGAGGQQLALLPDPSEAERDALLPIAEAAAKKSAPLGAGRPLGARNRRTDLLAQYIVDRYGDPLEGHVSAGMMPIRELVTELRKVASDCGLKLDASVMEIAKWQAELRRDAMPFIHAKRAPETAKGDPVVPVLGIGTFNQVNQNVTFQPGGRSIEDAIDVTPQAQQDQGVSDDKPE